MAPVMKLEMAFNRSRAISFKNSSLAKINFIKELVATYYGIPVEAMLSRARPEYIAWPRQVAMCLTRDLVVNITLSEVGHHFGGRHYGSVIHAIGRVKDRCDTEPAVKAKLEKFKLIIAQNFPT